MVPSNVVIQMPRLHEICPSSWANWRLFLVIHSIGIASQFQLYSDSVVGNLYPSAMGTLIGQYKDEGSAESAWELVIASREIGVAVGCILTIIINRKANLRMQLILGYLLGILGLLVIGIVILFDTTIHVVTFGRFLNGIGHGISQTVGIVFLLEISPQNKRGTAMAATVMWACAGEVAGLFFSLDSIMGNVRYWKVCMLAPLVLLIPAFYVLIKAPQSPRHLFKQGLEVEAKKSLAYYQNSADARLSEEEILKEITFLNNTQDENGNNKGENTSIRKRFNDGQFVRPLILACIVQGFVHLDDWLWISYSTPIFEKNGAPASVAQVASLLMAVPQTIVSIIFVGIFDNFDRKTLLLLPSCASAVIAAMASFFLSQNGTTMGSYYWLMIFATLDLCTAAISGESAFTIVPELFLPQDKVLGTAVAGIFQHFFGGFLTNYILTIINIFGTRAVLIPFALFTVAYVVINYRFLPETANRSPQEIAAQFSKEVPFKGYFASLVKTITRPTKLQAATFVLQMFFLSLVVHSGFKMFHVVFSRA